MGEEKAGKRRTAKSFQYDSACTPGPSPEYGRGELKPGLAHTGRDHGRCGDLSPVLPAACRGGQ